MNRSHVGWIVLAVSLVAMAAPPGCGGSGGLSGHGPSAGGMGGAAGMISGGAAGSCGTERLTAPEATSLYRKYAFEVQPDLNPTTVFEARELEVEGLWQGLNAQLFDVSGRAENGGFFRDCTILTHACRVFVPAGECSDFASPLSSGLVANGAFYFSWGSGSGVFRSQIGKLTPDGPQFTRVVSAASMNASYGPPPLVVQKAGTDILVYRANPTAFNQWSSADQLGKLDDRRDSLVVVDGSGQPIANPLP